jgi:hypothetical protein
MICPTCQYSARPGFVMTAGGACRFMPCPTGDTGPRHLRNEPLMGILGAMWAMATTPVGWALEEMDDPERAFQQIGCTPTRKSEKNCWPSRISSNERGTVRSFGRHPLPSQRHRRYWQ